MSWRELGFLRRRPDARSGAEIEAEVRAEIEHHLACAEDELLAAGRTPAQARSEARARFGDVAATRTTCLRIQSQGRIMLQRVHFAVTVLLFGAVLFLAWSSHRSNRRADLAAAHADAAAQALRAELGARQAVSAPLEHVFIEVGDELQFCDEYNPSEVHGVARVAADGQVLLPELGWVPVAGLTRAAAEQQLTAAYRQYFVGSQLRVLVNKPIAAFERVVFAAF